MPAGNRFCGQCGARQAELRPTANASLPLAPIEPRAQPAARAGEALSVRREVTVLFLDVTNFTAAAHALDSEDVFVWIDETMRLLAAVVHKYEGTIDKFTGDGLMALFGAPLAHENDPELAIRAALDMQAVVQPLRERILQKHGFDFQMRIGINTGLVVAGTVGDDAHMEYTVLGDTVNLAARLEKAAESGTILVSAATYQRTQPLFDYEILAPLSVKGVSEPLQTYRPLGPAERPGSVRGLPGLQTPMIGRAHLLGRLCARLDQVCRQQQSHVALVTGEAGLGKSRLVAEFRRAISPGRGAQLHDRPAAAAVRVYQGACLAYARTTPLWVVAAILRDLLRLSAIDPENIQREMLLAHLQRVGLVAQDVLPYLNNVLGLGQTDPEVEARLRLLDPAVLQRQIHAALRQIILAEAHQAPTVLVFDDLHWVDPASRDFLEYLIKTIGDAPLMLILVSRESERDTVVRPLIAAAEKNPDRLVDIQLRALSEAEGELLVDQIIRPGSAEAEALKQHIARRAAGNPFYIEEIVRILIDHGGLVKDGGGWQVTAQAAALLQEVPGTLKGLILTRYDRLPEPLRRTLQKAALLGRSFPASLLQLLDTASPAALTTQLQELEARQFLVAESFGWAQGYAFRHVLIQEAVYGTLLKRDRQKLHEQVGQLIERAAFWPQDERIEVLAYHYAESTTPAKAVPYLIDAAENAARRYANETAIRHYRRALELMPAQPSALHDDFFRVRAGLGQALKFVGEFVAASQVLTEALDHLQRQPGARLALLVNILRELADIRQREGAYDEAIAHLEVGLRALGATGAREEPDLWRSLMDRMAWVRFRQRQLDEALALAEAATQGVRPEYASDPITLASLFNTVGGIFWQRDDLSAAIAYVERSLDLYRGLSYAWGMAIAYTNLGILYYARGRWDRAADNFEQAYILRRENGYLPEQAINLYNLGMLRMVMGDHDRARCDLEASLVLCRRLGDDFVGVSTEIGLLQLAIIQSRFEDAAAHMANAERLVPYAGDEEAIQVRWLLGLLVAARGELASGLICAAQALAMARAAGRAEQERECLRVLGALRARAGEHLEAEACLQESLTLCREQHDLYRQGLALWELGQLYERLSKSGKAEQPGSQAVAAYTGAAEIFEQLGAAYDLRLARVSRERVAGRLAQGSGSARQRDVSFVYVNQPPEVEHATI